MVDFTSPNLQGANIQFNNIVSKLNDTKSSALANLQADASSASSALSTQLSGVTNELRLLVPEPSSIPNVNLQAQLQSLSGLTDQTQSANLLADIRSKFGSELTASGFNLDTLVTDAKSAVGSGTTLSGVIPNFELSAAGDVIQKASASLLPSIAPLTEEAATFVSNTDFTTTKTTATNAVYTTFETLPTADAGYIKISEKFKKVTQAFGGISITKELTTPLDSFENNIRKTVSPKGFSNRVLTISEKFTTSDMEEISGDKVVTLKHEPIKIEKVVGKTTKAEGSFTRFELLSIFRPSELLRNFLQNKYNKDLYSINLTNNKQVVFKQEYRTYDATPWAIKITYKYNETYDPNYATA